MIAKYCFTSRDGIGLILNDYFKMLVIGQGLWEGLTAHVSWRNSSYIFVIVDASFSSLKL